MKRALLAVAIIAIAAGCSRENDETTSLLEPVNVKVYLLRDEKVWPVNREVVEETGGAGGALDQIADGPTDREAAELGLTTALPETASYSMSLEDGVARVELDVELSPEGLAQLVYTLTQFPTVRSVDLEGGATVVTGFDRDDFEELTPAVLVEAPLSFEEVTSPLRVTGTANTFEANFQYELIDSDGRVIAENFVTATSGTGTRGTFEFTVPFEFTGDGTLTVFESSAKDGSRINVAEIPLRLGS